MILRICFSPYLGALTRETFNHRPPFLKNVGLYTPLTINDTLIVNTVLCNRLANILRPIFQVVSTQLTEVHFPPFLSSQGGEGDAALNGCLGARVGEVGRPSSGVEVRESSGQPSLRPRQRPETAESWRCGVLFKRKPHSQLVVVLGSGLAAETVSFRFVPKFLLWKITPDPKWRGNWAIISWTTYRNGPRRAERNQSTSAVANLKLSAI